jgi:hypothetical protein
MMSAVFPSTVRGLTYSVKKYAEFNTLIQTAANRYEVRIAQTRNPVWHWELEFGYLKDFPGDLVSGLADTDMKALMGFYLARSGQAESFLFTDPSDTPNVGGSTVCTVGPAVRDSNPSPAAALQVVTDGAGSFYSPLQRLWLDGNFYEDITDLNPSNAETSVAVYSDGALVASGGSSGHWSLEGPGLALPGLSFMGLYLDWHGAAPAGVITAEFSYYYRVRFETDNQEFDEFMDRWWELGSALKLISARPT